MAEQERRLQVQAVMIDMQDKLLAAMPEAEKLLENTERLLKGLRLLEIPVTVTQQNTKGLGPTDSGLIEAGGLKEYYDKMTYSCFADEKIRKDWLESGKKTFILFGIESHICLWQTAGDLLKEGFEVQIVCDCIASRKSYDKEVALRRLERAGAVLMTTEAVLFELLERAGTPEFKAISKLVK